MSSNNREKGGKFQICYFSFRFLNNIDRSMQNGGGPIFIFDDNGLTVCLRDDAP